LFTGVKPPDALARATALVSGRGNPLKPANEINCAVEPELAAILSCAMAQNPDERFASAAEFREALRRLGRVEDADMRSPGRDSENESVNDNLGDETIVKSVEMGTRRSLGSHAIAAIFVILLAAFGVFCHYYPWKLPTNAVRESMQIGLGTPRPIVNPATSEGNAANKARSQKAAAGHKRIV
jgi:hypothetical protein